MRARATILGLALLALGLVAGPAGAAERELEYRVKAAFLYNFARFVDWPELDGAEGPTRFDVCVYQPDPFGQTLDATLSGKAVHGEPIGARRIAPGEDWDGCRILYIPDTVGNGEREAILQASSRRPVLTVGEDADFNSEGGIVRFLLDQGSVRFAINLTAAQQAKLQISSKLLRIAKTVETPGES